MWEDDPGTKITGDEWEHMSSSVHETVFSNKNDDFSAIVPFYSSDHFLKRPVLFPSQHNYLQMY